MKNSFFRLLSAAISLQLLASCAGPAGFYSQPSVQQAHAVLNYDGLRAYGSPVPTIQVIEINGKTAPTQMALTNHDHSYRLHPGPVHLFVQARTGRNVGASGHLDFIARSGATYRMDLAVGMKDVAFLVTENGKKVTVSTAPKAVTQEPASASAPVFIPIMVN